MKEHSHFWAAVSLTAILILNPLLALASNRKASEHLGTPGSTGRSTRTVGRAAARAKPSTKIRRNESQRDPAGLAGQSTTLLPDGRLLLIGGEGPDGPVDTAAITDPRTNESELLSNRLHRARSLHSATMLPDGTVLVLGGVGVDGRIVEPPEIFDPETQKFEALQFNNLIPRVYHSATLLTDGLVLIAGGLSRADRPLRTLELWDPSTRTATRLAARLKTARYSHTATLLPSGGVLLSGGMDNRGAEVETSELYSAGARSVGLIGAGSVQAEREELRVEASLPSDGASGVSVSTRIALRFSKRLRVETVSAGNVTLVGPEGPVAVKVVPAEAGMLGFVTPRERLQPGASYRLSLSGLGIVMGSSWPTRRSRSRLRANGPRLFRSPMTRSGYRRRRISRANGGRDERPHRGSRSHRCRPRPV